MKFVNLTAHTVRIIQGAEVVTIEPDKPTARVIELIEREKEVDVFGSDIPVRIIRYGNTEGLPALKEGVAYIVSRITAAACIGRKDVYFPADEVRDSDGQIIGCRVLGQFS